MGLSHELWSYAENIWRRFPAEFISLGSPDLEDFFELCEGGAWCHRVVDTKSEKVIEIVLPRKEVPRSGDDAEEAYEDDTCSLRCSKEFDRHELDRQLTPDHCDGDTSVADFEAALRELDALNAVVGRSSQRVPESVAAEVNSQLQALKARRAREPSEDEMALSPDFSPDMSPHSGSSVTFNPRPEPSRDAAGLRGRALKKEGLRLDDIDQAGVGSPWEDSPSVSPASSASALLSRTETSPSPLPSLSCTTASPPTSKSVLKATSMLAVRRDFFIYPVRTRGLRKVPPGSVYRAPHLDRMATGVLVSKTLWARRRANEPSSPSSPFEEAWRRRRSSRGEPARQNPESRSCSPPDVKYARRRLGSSGNNALQGLEAAGGVALPAAVEGYPESPGARIQRIAAQRTEQARDLPPGQSASTAQLPGDGNPPRSFEPHAATQQRQGVSEPRSPSKRNRQRGL
jgi:hypothetical protein